MGPECDPHTADLIADTPPSWLAGLLAERRPLVMGILNVTPDSFSDGGRFIDPERAIAQAQRMIAAGADIIDIGAESTRPYGGAAPVSSADELARLTPVLPAVVKLETPVSIDTMKADIATWALDQGAAMVNDVWGLQRDPAMAEVVSEYDVPVVVMHNRESADPAIDIIADVQAFFERSLAIAERRRHRARLHRARSRHRLRQDAGTEHRLHRAARRIQDASGCRFWSAPRASASSMR